jgi:hypothetical protein
VHGHTASRQLVGSLDGPSRTFTVEPLQGPATQPAPPAIDPEPRPEGPERAPAHTEPAPAHTEPAPTP